MTRLTVEVPDDVAERVADAAAQQGVAPEQLASQVLADSFPPESRLSFIGIGRSGRGDLSERHKEIRRDLLADRRAEEA
jgi:hypothetical protein